MELLLPTLRWCIFRYIKKIHLCYFYWRVSKKVEKPAMFLRLLGSQHSSCEAREKKIKEFLSTFCINCISSINFDFLLLLTPQKPSQYNLQDNYRYRLFINQQYYSRSAPLLWRLALHCPAFSPFPRQSFPVGWLPVSRDIPRKNNRQKGNTTRTRNWQKETTIMLPPNNKGKHLGEARDNSLLRKHNQHNQR